jgi:hypothetical protein
MYKNSRLQGRVANRGKAEIELMISAKSKLIWDSIYDEGQIAFLKRIASFKNPYTKRCDKRKSDAWFQGWIDASNGKTKRTNRKINMQLEIAKDHPVKRTLDMRDHDLMMEINDKIQNKKIKRRIKIKESSDQKLEAKKNMIAFTRKLKENRERVERDRREKEKGVA